MAADQSDAGPVAVFRGREGAPDADDGELGLMADGTERVRRREGVQGFWGDDGPFGVVFDVAPESFFVPRPGADWERCDEERLVVGHVCVG